MFSFDVIVYWCGRDTKLGNWVWDYFSQPPDWHVCACITPLMRTHAEVSPEK